MDRVGRLHTYAWLFQSASKHSGQQLETIANGFACVNALSNIFSWFKERIVNNQDRFNLRDWWNGLTFERKMAVITALIAGVSIAVHIIK